MKKAYTLHEAALAAAGLDHFPVLRDWLKPEDRERKRAELAAYAQKKKAIERATSFQVRPGVFRLRAEHRAGEVVSIEHKALRGFVEAMAAEDASWEVTRQLQTPEEQGRSLADSPNAYTPELALALKAYRHFWEKLDPTSIPAKSETIVAWLKEQHHGLSNNMAEAIDQLVRPLYARKGGQKKLAQGAKPPSQKA